MIRTIIFANFALCAFLASNVAAQEKKQITLYWSDARQDFFTSASEAGDRNAKAANYVVSDAKSQGRIWKTQKPGTVPLIAYWSAKHQDCLTMTADIEALNLKEGDGYQQYETLGYIYKEKNLDAQRPLVLYRNTSTNDFLTTAMPPADLIRIKHLDANNYDTLGRIGYVITAQSVSDLKSYGGVLHYEGVWDWNTENTSNFELDPNKPQIKYTYQHGDRDPLVVMLPYSLVDNEEGHAVLEFTLPDGNHAQFVWTSLGYVQGKFWLKGVAKTADPATRTTMERVNLASSPAATEGNRLASSNVLKVPIYAQQTSMWCWATGGEMIMKYHGVSVAQCKQANEYYKKDLGKEFTDLGIDCCGFLATGTTVDERIVKGGWPQFEDYGFTYKSKEDSPLSFAEIKAQIDAKQPIGFAWWWKSASGIPGGGHYMVLTGYKTIAGAQMVKINDPWPNNVIKESNPKEHTRWMTYSYWRESAKHSHGPDHYNIKKTQEIKNKQ